MVAQRYETVFKLYPYAKVPDQDAAPRRHPVVIVGGGPVGLGIALDLGQRGTPVLVLDDHDGVGNGSKAICFAKRTLEIAHRLGVGAQMLDKGVVWNVGKVFHNDTQLFAFDLLPEDGHRNPAFINLQQPYFEKFLFDGIKAAQRNGAPIEVRGRNAVTSVRSQSDHVRVEVDTPDGPYTLEADWLIACDGARSPTRSMLGLDFDGRVFEDNFLIADVRMTADFPTERWFWFEPPFKDSGQSALLHKQPDDVWRIDFQLGWDIDRDRELDEDRIRARVDAMLSSQTGQVPDYELVWTSIYTFQCRRMKDFRHGRVFFAGDSAHQVSPFGARGANSGMQDAENIAWKLDLVIKGLAPDTLLDSYGEERGYAADENILNSSRATDFMTPKSDMSKTFRNAVLDLAGKHSFARPLVNSGRLSVPCVYDDLSCIGPDLLNGPTVTRPGAACTDAPDKDRFLLDRLTGKFQILAIGGDAPDGLLVDGAPIDVLHLADPSDALRARFLGDALQAIYLIRPDQHIVARWPSFDAQAVQRALTRTLGKE
ncbi:FAD-dependent oxidoreductase [Yoonia sp. R2331]|uniref:FAD-dependent oxidoreductase n=1 Tax=Yoonia sp. R2331 TaxID=3237238 RepID=UPI0034E491A0